MPSAATLLAIRRETFTKTPLFWTLDPADRDQLAALATPHQFGPGATLFYEGDPCAGLWVLGSGAVKITKTSPSGREIMLARESAPSSIAEVPLFDDGGYPANATAIEETLAFLLHKDDFRRFCEQHPRVPLKVLAVVGKRLRTLVQLIETVTFGSVRDVIDDCRKTLEIMMPGGGYCFAPTHCLQDNSPLENVLAMYETAEKCGTYA